MALPVINVPTYKAKIPSTEEEVTFRPFLVKEEKILLARFRRWIRDDSIAQAIKQIINNCTFEKIEPDKLATFDLEYVFLRIQS